MAVVLFASFTVFSARYAILVGNSSAGKGFEKLRYVERDIDELAHALTLFCDFDSRNVVKLVDGSPMEMFGALDLLSEKIASSSDKDLFLFYYTGHADRDNLLMGWRKLSFSDLHDRFETFPGKIRIGVFDACQSGAFARAKGGRPAEPFIFREEENIEGQVILYSSSANENSQESDIYKNSVFTFHFVNALRGAADVTGDGLVTLSEAYRYSYDQTVSSTARSRAGAQHPGYRFRIQGEGNIVLADLKKRSAGLLLPEDITGLFTVLSGNNSPVAELSKKKGRPLLVALSPGEYRIVRTFGERISEAGIVIDTSGIRRVAETDFRELRNMITVAKGEPGFVSSIGFEFGGALFSPDLTPLEKAITGELEILSTVGLSTNPRFPTLTGEWFLNVELSSTVGIWWHIGGRYTSVETSWEDRGKRSGPENTGEFETALQGTAEVVAFAARAGIGYSPPIPVLRNAAVYGGLNVVLSKVDFTVVYTDELFDQDANNSHSDNGIAVAPHIGVRYRQLLPGGLAAGIFGEYRLPNTRESVEPGKYACSQGGWQAGVSIAVLFGGKRP